MDEVSPTWKSPESRYQRRDNSGAIRMSLTLYAHPFAAYCWKALIALYENATPFDYRVIEDAAGWAELESLWPIKKFPLLRDGEATVVESSIIVDYLTHHHPGPERMIPADDDAALKVRFMDRCLCWTSPMDGSNDRLRNKGGLPVTVCR